MDKSRINRTELINTRHNKPIPNRSENPLGTEDISVLLRKFAVPSIIAMLVGSLYNIVDQFFIGQTVGELGNAATNIAFPMSICCIAVSLMFGIGGAAAFNIALGQKKKDIATYYVGNAITSVLLFGVFMCIVTKLFLTSILTFIGSPADVLPFASTYASITALGFPLLILSTTGGHIIRADGSPKVTMMINMSGAGINIILDTLFVFILKLGMAGAAWATVIGQLISASIVILYIPHFKTVKLERKHFIPNPTHIKRIMSLGAASLCNQLAMMVVQIVLNKSLNYYGGLSIYGKAIPLACAGISMKVSQLFFAFQIGLTQGMQPIASFNHGAEKHDRVKEVYLKTIKTGAGIAATAFVLFQLFPTQIISVFGKGSSPEYYMFAAKFFRIFLFCTFINFIQPITSNMFTAIGKPKKGIILSLTRQVIFLLPLLLILPKFFGIDGILFAGPIADGLAAIAAVVMSRQEFSKVIYRKNQL